MPRPVKETSDNETASMNETSQLTKRKRLNLDLTPAAYGLLLQIASDSGRSMTDVLRTGLALVGIAQEQAKRGRSLGIVEDDKVIKEILLP